MAGQITPYGGADPANPHGCWLCRRKKQAKAHAKTRAAFACLLEKTKKAKFYFEARGDSWYYNRQCGTHGRLRPPRECRMVGN
jgi:hypothetical protein